MEIRVLQYFLAIAREQSIIRAAESLHLSQPTLSTQIKNMEGYADGRRDDSSETCGRNPGSGKENRE